MKALLPPAPEPEWTKQQQSTFRYLLSKVKLKAFTYEGGLAVRPENVGKFKELCDQSGLANVREVGYVIKALQTMPGEFIRFEKA